MNDDLDRLICRYLDGTATREEVARLQSDLAALPGGADRLLRAALMEATLREALAPRGGAGRSGAGMLPARRNTIRSPWAHFGVMAASVLVVAAGVWWVTRPRPTGISGPPAVVQGAPSPGERAMARVVAAGPGVSFERAGATQPATSAAALAPGDRIRTGPDTSAELAFDGEGTRLTLGPTSVLGFEIEGKEGKNALELIQGELRCRADRRPPDRPLVVTTPQAHVRVVGTRFGVAAAGGWTRVQVEEGTVRVTRRGDGSTVDVSGGEYVDVQGNGRDARPAAPAPAWPRPPAGRNMGEFWSVKVRPAGIEQ